MPATTCIGIVSSPHVLFFLIFYTLFRYLHNGVVVALVLVHSFRHPDGRCGAPNALQRLPSSPVNDAQSGPDNATTGPLPCE